MSNKHEVALRTLPSILRANAEAFADDVFLRDRYGTLTWGQTWELSQRTAAGFAKLGVSQGDRVVLMLDNCREVLAAWFGLGYLGAVEVPANPAGGRPRLAHILNQSGAQTVVVHADNLDVLAAAAAEVPGLQRVVVVGEGSLPGVHSVPFDALTASVGAPPREVQVSDPVAIMYTSGSTGPAKGVVVPHGQHYMNGWQAVNQAGLTTHDQLLLCLPLHHNMAQGYGIWPALISRASVTLVDRFERGRFWQQAGASGATVFPFVGAMIALLAADDAKPPAHALRLGYGVPLPVELHERFECTFGVELLHCYGSTEATIPVWGSTGTGKVFGAAGKVVPDFEVEIHDSFDKPVATGGVGEICVRPREPYSMFLGYHNDPARTAEAMRNQWFHTGDDGRFDSEENLWFVRRAGDVIRRFGEFVSAPEVEAVLDAHPDVELSAVVGVPSDLIDEDVLAFVVLRDGKQTSAKQLRHWCEERLPSFAVPRFIDLTDQLPMTATGKCAKYKVKDRGLTSSTYDARAERSHTDG